MPPRHFWWLAETLGGSTKRKGLDDDTRAQLQHLLRNAEKGKV